MTLTCGCWRCTGKAHNDGTIHAEEATTSASFLDAYYESEADPSSTSTAYCDPLYVEDEEPWPVQSEEDKRGVRWVTRLAVAAAIVITILALGVWRHVR